MIKIIVADDEENIRDIVAAYISKVDNNFQVVGRAENGEEALSLVQELEPDILISDICMPGMDGLELIRRVREQKPYIKNIIISGYNEFEYAKTAISLGVEEYLLKPFLPDDLMEILERIKEELNKQSILEKNMLNMQNTIEKNRMKMQETYIASIIIGNQDELSLIKEGNELAIDIFADMYTVCGIRFVTEGNISSQKTIWDQLFYNVRESYFDSRVKSFMTMLPESNEIIILFGGDFHNNISFKNCIEKGLTKLLESTYQYYSVEMQCALGSIRYQWEQIADSYQEVQMIWKGTVEKEEAIQFYDVYKKKNMLTMNQNQWSRPEKLEKELLLQIQMSRREDAIDTLNQIIQCYSSYTLDMASRVDISLMDLVVSISDAVKKAGGNYTMWEDKELTQYLMVSFQKGSLLETRKVFGEYILKCCDEFAKLNEKQSDKIVYAVKELIEKNIANDEFTLDTVSNELYFSIHYIRQLFKQNTGENFQEYVIKRRMETAKTLLLDKKGYKMAEIAEMTGYKNQRYFATTFKKYYGCTPTEFRQE